MNCPLKPAIQLLQNRSLLGALLLAMTLGAIPILQAQEPLPVADLNRESPVDFNEEIVPFLKKNCLACHNETKAKAKLILESPETILKGGDSGPSIIPGNAADSFLFTTAAHQEEPIMPPAKNKSKAENLNPEQLALLKLWIDQGAKGTAKIAAAAPDSWLQVDSNAIYTVAISHDGRFAACGRGHGIQIYDLLLNQFVADLSDPDLGPGLAHRDLVQSLAFARDGTLASGGFRNVKLWRRPDVLPLGKAEVKTREAVAIEGMPEEIATAPIRLLIGENQKQLLAAGKDATIRIYEVADWKLSREFPVGLTPVQVALNQSETHLAVAAKTGPANLIQLSDGKVTKTLELAPDFNLAIERIQREEAKENRLSGIYLAEIPKLEEAWKKEGEAADNAGKEIPKAQQTRAEKRAEFAKKQRTLQLAEVALNAAPEDANLQKAVETAMTALEAAEAETTNANRAIELATRNRDLASKLTGDAARKLAEAKAKKATSDSAIELLKAQREAFQKQLAEVVPKLSIAGIAFSETGDEVFTGLTTGNVLGFATASGGFLESFSCGSELTGFDIAANGEMIISTKAGTSTWNSNRSWEKIGQIGDGANPEVLIDRVSALAFSPDDQLLVTGSGVPSRSGRLKAWNVGTWEQVAENLEAHSDTISEVVFSPDGSEIATGATDKFVKTFSATSLEHLQSFEAHTGHVLSVDWSPDGRHLASASADNEVKLWGLETGEQVKTLKGWMKEVTSVSFVSGASEQVITTSGDQSIKLDTTAISGSSGFLFTSAVSADGKWIVAGGADGVLRVWTSSDRKLVQSFAPPESNRKVAARR